MMKRRKTTVDFDRKEGAVLKPLSFQMPEKGNIYFTYKFAREKE